MGRLVVTMMFFWMALLLLTLMGCQGRDHRPAHGPAPVGRSAVRQEVAAVRTRFPEARRSLMDMPDWYRELLREGPAPPTLSHEEHTGIRGYW